MPAVSLVVTLLVTYVVGVLVTRWIVVGAFALDRLTVWPMVVVPFLQAAVLIVWRRLTRRRS